MTIETETESVASDPLSSRPNARFAFSATNVNHASTHSEVGAPTTSVSYGTFDMPLENSQSVPDFLDVKEQSDNALQEMWREHKKKRRSFSHSVDFMNKMIAPPFLLPSNSELRQIAPDSSEGEDSTETRLPPLTRRQILSAISLAIVNFCSTCVFSCIAPFFPDEATKKGATSWEIGLIFGIFEFCVFLFSPIVGKVIYAVGAKNVYVLGLFVTGFTNILFGTLNMSPAGSTFVGLAFAVRIVEATGDAMFLTASFSITAKEFPGRVSTMIGILETFGGLGFTAGPAVGGLLYQAGGFGLAFYVLGGLLIAAAAVSIVLLPTPTDFKAEAHGGFLKLLKRPTVVLMAFAVFCCAITLAFLDPTLEPHLKSLNVSPMVVGFIFLILGFCYTISAPLVGYVVDKVGNGLYGVLAGSLVVFVAYLLLGPSPIFGFQKTLWMIGVSLALLGSATGLQLIPIFNELIEQAQESGYPDNFQTYGMISGLFQSSMSLGAFIGPTLGGSLAGAIGFEWSTTVLSFLHLLLAAMFAVYLFYRRRRRRVAMEAIPLLDDLDD